MNRKIIAIILLGILGALSISYIEKTVSPDAITEPVFDVATTSKETAENTNNWDPSKLVVRKEIIRETFNDFDSFFKDRQSLHKLSFTSSTTKNKISFRVLTDVVHQARNPTFDLLLNGERIGEVGGQGASQFSFSSDERYFSFRARFQSGCCASDFDIYVVDTLAKEVITIRPPHTQNDVLTSKDRMFVWAEFIESFGWINNNLLKVYFYIVSADKNGTYRVSPREIWSYDLNTKQYTLLQTLPE